MRTYPMDEDNLTKALKHQQEILDKAFRLLAELEINNQELKELNQRRIQQ